MKHFPPQKYYDCGVLCGGCRDNQRVVCFYLKIYRRLNQHISLFIMCFASDATVHILCQALGIPPALAALSGIQSAPVPPPPGKHHLRPPVSHCSPAGSWESFSTQMSANKEMHVRERGKKEAGGGGGRWCVW